MSKYPWWCWLGFYQCPSILDDNYGCLICAHASLMMITAIWFMSKHAWLCWLGFYQRSRILDDDNLDLLVRIASSVPRCPALAVWLVIRIYISEISNMVKEIISPFWGKLRAGQCFFHLSAVFYYLSKIGGATPFLYPVREVANPKNWVKSQKLGQIPKIGSNPKNWLKSQILVHQIRRSYVLTRLQLPHNPWSSGFDLEKTFSKL